VRPSGAAAKSIAVTITTAAIHTMVKILSYGLIAEKKRNRKELCSAAAATGVEDVVDTTLSGTAKTDMGKDHAHRINSIEGFHHAGASGTW
jgi:hypothetical protein